MDEFELFRARAYGGGLGVTPAEVTPGKKGDEDGSLLTAVVRSNSKPRRHSSVGVCRIDALGLVTPIVGNCDGGGGGGGVTTDGKSSQRSSDDRWTNKPRLTSQVTVAIEPPSPTDNRTSDGYNNRQQQQQQSRVHQRTQNEALGDEDDDDDGEDDVEWRRKNLHRTKTAPPSTRTLSPGKQRIADDIRRHQEEEKEEEEEFQVNGLNYCASDPDEETALLQHQQMFSSDEDDHRLRSCHSSTKRSRRTLSPSLDRPHCLRLSPSTTETAQRRTRSRRGSAVEDSLLLPTQLPSPPTTNSRRNSSAGTQSPKLTSPPPSTSHSGRRRGSAITYLTDVPVEGSTWRLSSTAVSPVRLRSSCVEDRCGGGLSVDDIKAHLEELTLAAAKTAGTVGPAGFKRPSVSSEASSAAGERQPQVYRVMVVGGSRVGKTTLTNQLMTSEYLANKENEQGMRCEKIINSA